MYEVYTDGACSPNPGHGGWAYVVIHENVLITNCRGRVENTTSNRMEYLAVINSIKDHGKLITNIYTDSQLLVNTCNSWRFKWKQNNWMLKKNKAIKNLDLVLEIDNLLNKYPSIKINWIKGHNGHEWNELVDELANKEAGIKDHFKCFK